MTTTEKIAKFIVEADFEAMTEDTVKIGKQAIIDTVAAILGSSKEKGTGIFTKVVRDLGGNPEARIVVNGIRATAPDVAFVHGAMADLLEYSDNFSDPVSHPSCTVVPVVLALGEKLKSSGKKMIEGYMVGMETGGKICMAADADIVAPRTWLSIQYQGALQAAAAAAKMLKLSMGQTRIALAIVSTMAAGLRVTYFSMIKGFHTGNTARNGIMAALLAKEGFTGIDNVIEVEGGFADTFFGKGKYDLDKMTDTLGNPYRMVQQGIDFKKYPCCMGNHWTLDALLPLIEEHKISYEDIEAVDVISPPRPFLDRPQPRDELEAKFSIYYVIGATILEGKPVIETFRDEKVFSSRYKEAMKKVNMIYTDKNENRVVVRLKNGQSYENSTDYPRNMSFDETLVKYRECAGIALPQKQIERSLDLLLNLEKVNDVTDLMDALMEKTR